jgi:hypothetical protein
VGAKTQKYSFNGKEYTEKDLTDTLGKVGKFQSDRDIAEKTTADFVRQIRAAGMDVDPNTGQIIQPQATVQAPNEKELAQKAVLGDEEALMQLLNLRDQESQKKFYSGAETLQRNREIVDEVKKDYPDFYNEDGSLNYDSPISKEALRLLERNPHLGAPQNALILAEAANGRLLKKGLPGMQQQIKNNAQQKLAQTAATTTAQPGEAGEQEDLSNVLNAGQKRAAMKLGQDPTRIARVMQRARQKGGFYIG